MSLDGLQRETVGEGGRVTDELLSQTSADLSDLGNQVEQIAESRGQDVADSIEIDTQLEADLSAFIEAAVNNQLGDYTGEFNAEAFDKDGEIGLDQFEFEQFSQSLDAAIDQIILLDGLGTFNNVHEDSATDNWYEVDRHVANGLNALTDGALDLMIGDDQDGSLAEKLLNGLNLSDAEIQAMKDKSFSTTSAESWKELGILLALELGEGAEDIIRFLINIPAATILIPRYTALRIRLNSSDPQEAAEAEIILDELVSQNPALGLLNLLGEDGIQAIQTIASMMTSGKQGDIALTAVSIAGLLAGGAGAVRLGARMGRMSRLESVAARVQHGAERVDDIVGGAGIGHLTGGFSSRADATITPQQVDPATQAIDGIDGSQLDGDNANIDMNGEPPPIQEEAPIIARESPVRKIDEEIPQDGFYRANTEQLPEGAITSGESNYWVHENPDGTYNLGPLYGSGVLQVSAEIGERIHAKMMTQNDAALFMPEAKQEFWSRHNVPVYAPNGRTGIADDLAEEIWRQNCHKEAQLMLPNAYKTNAEARRYGSVEELESALSGIPPDRFPIVLQIGTENRPDHSLVVMGLDDHAGRMTYVCWEKMGYTFPWRLISLDHVWDGWTRMAKQDDLTAWIKVAED